MELAIPVINSIDFPFIDFNTVLLFIEIISLYLILEKNTDPLNFNIFSILTASSSLKLSGHFVTITQSALLIPLFDSLSLPTGIIKSV